MAAVPDEQAVETVITGPLHLSFRARYSATEPVEWYLNNSRLVSPFFRYVSVRAIPPVVPPITIASGGSTESANASFAAMRAN